MALALLAVPLAVGRRSIHAAEPVKPDEDPAPRLLELKDLTELDPLYTDPKMMERHLQKVDPRFNNSLANEMGLLKPTFEEWCDEFKDGSRVTDFDSFTYDSKQPDGVLQSGLLQDWLHVCPSCGQTAGL